MATKGHTTNKSYYYIPSGGLDIMQVSEDGANRIAVRCDNPSSFRMYRSEIEKFYESDVAVEMYGEEQARLMKVAVMDKLGWVTSGLSYRSWPLFGYYTSLQEEDKTVEDCTYTIYVRIDVIASKAMVVFVMDEYDDQGNKILKPDVEWFADSVVDKGEKVGEPKIRYCWTEIGTVGSAVDGKRDINFDSGCLGTEYGNMVTSDGSWYEQDATSYRVNMRSGNGWQWIFNLFRTYALSLPKKTDGGTETQWRNIEYVRDSDADADIPLDYAVGDDKSVVTHGWIWTRMRDWLTRKFVRKDNADGAEQMAGSLHINTSGKQSDMALHVLGKVAAEGEMSASDNITSGKDVIGAEHRTTNFKGGEFDGSGASVFEEKNEFDGSSLGYIETDYLTVRRSARFRELTIAEVKHVGGEVILSQAAGQVARVAAYSVTAGEKNWQYDTARILSEKGAYEETMERYITTFRLFFDNEANGKRQYNSWIVGDQVRCQECKLEAGTMENVRTSYYWRAVVGIGEDEQNGQFYIDVANRSTSFLNYIEDPNERIYYIDGRSMDVGCTTPKPNDSIALLGCRDKRRPERGSAQIYSTIEKYAPSRRYYHGITSFSLAGCMIERIEWDGSEANDGEPVGTNWMVGNESSSFIAFDREKGLVVKAKEILFSDTSQSVGQMFNDINKRVDEIKVTQDLSATEIGDINLQMSQIEKDVFSRISISNQYGGVLKEYMDRLCVHNDYSDVLHQCVTTSDVGYDDDYFFSDVSNGTFYDVDGDGVMDIKYELIGGKFYVVRKSYLDGLPGTYDKLKVYVNGLIYNVEKYNGGSFHIDKSEFIEKFDAVYYQLRLWDDAYAKILFSRDKMSTERLDNMASDGVVTAQERAYYADAYATIQKEYDGIMNSAKAYLWNERFVTILDKFKSSYDALSFALGRMSEFEGSSYKLGVDKYGDVTLTMEVFRVYLSDYARTSEQVMSAMNLAMQEFTSMPTVEKLSKILLGDKMYAVMKPLLSVVTTELLREYENIDLSWREIDEDARNAFSSLKSDYDKWYDGLIRVVEYISNLNDGAPLTESLKASIKTVINSYETSLKSLLSAHASYIFKQNAYTTEMGNYIEFDGGAMKVRDESGLVTTANFAKLYSKKTWTDEEGKEISLQSFFQTEIEDGVSKARITAQQINLEGETTVTGVLRAGNLILDKDNVFSGNESGAAYASIDEYDVVLNGIGDGASSHLKLWLNRLSNVTTLMPEWYSTEKNPLRSTGRSQELHVLFPSYDSTATQVIGGGSGQTPGYEEGREYENYIVFNPWQKEFFDGTGNAFFMNYYINKFFPNTAITQQQKLEALTPSLNANEWQKSYRSFVCSFKYDVMRQAREWLGTKFTFNLYAQERLLLYGVVPDFEWAIERYEGGNPVWFEAFRANDKGSEVVNGKMSRWVDDDNVLLTSNWLLPFDTYRHLWWDDDPNTGLRQMGWQITLECVERKCNAPVEGSSYGIPRVGYGVYWKLSAHRVTVNKYLVGKERFVFDNQYEPPFK